MSTFGAISYGTASVAFMLLLVMLLTGWRGRAAGRRLLLAVAATTAWAAVLAWQALNPEVRLLPVFSLELLRDGAWIGVMLGLGRSLVPRGVALGARLSWIGLLVAAWGLEILRNLGLSSRGPEAIFVPSGIAMALVVLVTLEQLYRNASATDRDALRFLVIGIGGVYAYDLFLYSQAALFEGVAEDAWFARGLVTALMVPLIAIAARRNPQWSLDIFVSRQVVMFTTSVVAIGVYLFLMSLGGYLLQLLGGRWGTAANIVFFFGAAAVLAVVVLSGVARRRLRVFLSKHFFRNKYDYRVEWLRFVDMLSGVEAADVRRTCIQAIAQIFDSPGGILYVRDRHERQYVPVAAWPMSLADLPELQPLAADDPLVALMAGRQWIVDLRQRTGRWRGESEPAIPAWLARTANVRLITPLLQGDRLRGLVMLYEPPPPFEPTYEDRDLLRTVGRHVATLVAQQEADQELADARQFEAYHRLTAFLMHDLKNAVAQLQLGVSNAARHRHNPEFIDDMITTVGNAIDRMNRLIEQMRGGGGAPYPQPVDLLPVAGSVVKRCADRAPVPALATASAGKVLVQGDSSRLSSALEHLVRNAQDACTPADRIELAIGVADGQALISVQDTGPGMSAAFVRERLFRPFDSTKGAKGMGIGAYQAREYVQSIGGSIQVSSRPGDGTRIEIRLPLLAVPAGDA